MHRPTTPWNHLKKCTLDFECTLRLGLVFPEYFGIRLESEARRGRPLIMFFLN